MDNIVQPKVITNRILIGKLLDIWINIVIDDIINILEIKKNEEIKKKIRMEIRIKINIEYLVLNKLRNILINNK